MRCVPLAAIGLTVLSVVQGHFRDFGVEVIDALKTAQFRPGAIEHCRVPTLVRVPFDFKMRGSGFVTGH